MRADRAVAAGDHDVLVRRHAASDLGRVVTLGECLEADAQPARLQRLPQRR